MLNSVIEVLYIIFNNMGFQTVQCRLENCRSSKSDHIGNHHRPSYMISQSLQDATFMSRKISGKMHGRLKVSAPDLLLDKPDMLFYLHIYSLEY